MSTDTQPGVGADLLSLSRRKLNDLYGRAEPGRVPSGHGSGTVLVATGTVLARPLARLVRAAFWQGKIFDPQRGQLVNLLGPSGVRAIRARVYVGNSWYDERPAIVLDYSRTSLIARWVRDEIREVDPGLYLGIAYVWRLRTVYFALRFPAAAAR